jgi:hypothetical protein
MNNLLGVLGNVAGIAGIVVCLFAGVTRLAGKYHVTGFETQTLFIGGMSLMVFACLVKLYLLERR